MLHFKLYVFTFALTISYCISMKKSFLFQSVLLLLIICQVSLEPVPVHVQNNNVYNTGLLSDNDDRIDFNEKLDYNKVKMSKLRLLLLGELFKHENALVGVIVWLKSINGRIFVSIIYPFLYMYFVNNAAFSRPHMWLRVVIVVCQYKKLFLQKLSVQKSNYCLK